MMWVLLAVSLFGFIIFVERTLFLHRGQLRTTQFIEGIRNLVTRDRRLEALTLCEDMPGPIKIDIAYAGSCTGGKKSDMDMYAMVFREALERGERVLVTTLTKRMSEDLSTYLAEVGVRVRYLHSEIAALERTAILADLRRGEFDVLVGINLLREGLDLPEVSLVAILDADQEGFLRSETSLIQTMGRAARNLNGRTILYADRRTGSMERAITETLRRREVQASYNAEHGIEPRTIIKDVASPLVAMSNLDYHEPRPLLSSVAEDRELELEDEASLSRLITELEKRMRAAAKALEFEEAARLRDRIRQIRRQQIYKT